MRTDIHRPSVINPVDYDYIGFDYLGSDIEMCDAASDERKGIKEFCKTKSIDFSEELDKITGQCQCCGAHALYYGVFYHAKTNVLLWLGHICAEKMGLVKQGEFVKYREGLNTRVIHLKNVKLARETCLKHEIDLERFAVEDDGSWEQKTLKSMWFNLIQYHTFSDKQAAFAKKLIDKIEHPIVVEEKHREKAIDGRHEVKGKILGFKEQESQFGTTTKALIETEKGWKLYVTVPQSSYVYNEDGTFKKGWEKGDEVKIVVTVEVSKDDPFFAFGKRPKIIQNIS